MVRKLKCYQTCDLSFASTETKYIKLKPKIILLFLDFFLQNDIVILAFFEKKLTELQVSTKKITCFSSLVFYYFDHPMD